MSLDNLPEMLVPLISDTTSKKQELNISQSGLEDDSELHHIPAWHEPVRILYHFLNSIFDLSAPCQRCSMVQWDCPP